MDGLHEIAPRKREFQFLGRTLRLSQLRLRSYAEIEAEVLRRKPSPLDVVAPTVRDMPLEQAKYLLGLAYDDSLKARRAEPREIDEFLSTIDGLAFTFWLAVRDAHPDVTQEQVSEWLYGLDKTEIERVQAELDQLEPPRGNGAGRPSQPAATNGASVPLGVASSAN